ncbi:hypothetical protein ACEUAZ_01385 [Aeromonas veronii]
MNFTFPVYSRRWGHIDNYQFTHNSNGWHIEHIAINGQSAPDGSPFLYSNFDQDFINYPSGIGFMLQCLWEQLQNQEISQADAQAKLNELAQWVSQSEQSTPHWDGVN